MLFAEYPSAADTPPNLRAFWRKTELSFGVLKALEETGNSASTGGKTSPVFRKKGKVVMKNSRIDPLPFDSMGISVPTTDAEIRDAYVGVLAQLQSILEVCGSIAGTFYMELNTPSITFSFSGCRHCQKFSNSRTPRQTHHRKEGFP